MSVRSYILEDGIIPGLPKLPHGEDDDRLGSFLNYGICICSGILKPRAEQSICVRHAGSYIK